MTLTLQKVTIKINENRTFYLLERNVIRMKRRIQALTLALCFCTAFLFSSCSFMQKQEEPQVQNHSELTSNESFPIKLNVGEAEYRIASKPRSLAVLSADLVQALGDIGAASLISGACTDAPSSVSLSASQSCGTALNPNLQQLIACARTGCWFLFPCVKAASSSWSRRVFRSSALTTRTASTPSKSDIALCFPFATAWRAPRRPKLF